MKTAQLTVGTLCLFVVMGYDREDVQRGNNTLLCDDGGNLYLCESEKLIGEKDGASIRLTREESKAAGIQPVSVVDAFKWAGSIKEIPGDVSNIDTLFELAAASFVDK